MQYPIALIQQNQHYVVTIPDIKGLTANGENMAEVVANARLAIINHLYNLLENDLPIPEPSPVTNHLNKTEYAGYIWAIVSVELSRIIGESMDVTIKLPKQLCHDISIAFPDQSFDRMVLLALKQYLKTNFQTI